MMHQPSMDSWHKNGPIFPKCCLLVCIFILIATQKFAASGALETVCSLNIQLSPSLNDSSCQEGDWGGFLHDKCCGAAFDAYIYALGQHANRTGQIFINSTEQRECLSEMKSFKDNVFSCGIKKLSSGGGGCSDFSVADVMNILGEEVRSLDVNCQFETSDRDMAKVYSSCLGTWRSIGGTDSTNTNIKFEANVCRIAVLVSLISTRGKNEAFLHTIQRCLGAHNMNIDKETSVDKQKMKSKKGIWILIGTIIGLILLIAIVIVATVVLCRCKHLKSTPRKKAAAFEQLLSKETSCPRFPLKEVYAATNDLSEINVIGEGTAGKVYKGTMSNKQDVAIKHIINDENMETFVREVTSLSHVKHPNLVSLLGCCVDGDECFLVYELCPNGSLSQWLFGKNKVLSWIQRLEIAIDSARGLWFLHTYPEGCIVHRDIKPTNILLGPKFEAKLSDFGLSKVIEVGETYVSSEVRGTFGYVDPEYQGNRRVNSSGDVYSFGMVLLQILSGRKAINLKLKKPMTLNKMAKVLTRGGSITEFADPKLRGEYSEEAFDFILQLALSCTALKQQRPSMEQVVTKLEEALLISTVRKVSTVETPVDNPSDP